MLDVCVRADRLDVSFPVVVCINGFRGFLDEFVKKLENKELPEVKVKRLSVKRRKKKRTKQHTLVTSNFHDYCYCCNYYCHCQSLLERLH